MNEVEGLVVQLVEHWSSGNPICQDFADRVIEQVSAIEQDEHRLDAALTKTKLRLAFAEETIAQLKIVLSRTDLTPTLLLQQCFFILNRN